MAFALTSFFHVNTRACKQVICLKSICLSCKVCWILSSQNIWNKKLINEDEWSACGLSDVEVINIYQCHVIKKYDVTAPNREVAMDFYWGVVLAVQE